MGNNASKSRLTNQERSLNRTKLISNFVEKNNNLDSLNITEFHNNVKIPLQLNPVSSLNKVGGGVVKQNNAFNEQMIKHEIFNLLHDTEIQQYHYNNMKASGILNSDNNVITGGAVVNQPVPVSVNSDVSDAMDRIKQVIMAELGTNGTQQGGAANTSNSAGDSDSNTNGCGCGSENEKGYKHKCGNENGKKKSKKGKRGKKGEKGIDGSSSSSSDGSSSDGSSDGSSSSSSVKANYNGLKNSGKGLSIFPFNSSDVQSSEKNFRLMRRKI
jgi:hypothetical protein